MNDKFLERANKKIQQNESIGIHSTTINEHEYEVQAHVFSPGIFLGT